MLKHILVPLDSSELAESALPYARQIVADDGRITLLMVVDNANLTILAPSIDFHISPEIEQSLRNKMKKNRRDYLDLIAPTLDSNIQIEMIVQIGNPAEEIISFADSSDVDVIVMSTHGRTGLSRWVMGSVTQKVLNVATCPVFVIPQQK